jgi:hypothetical protein
MGFKCRLHHGQAQALLYRLDRHAFGQAQVCQWLEHGIYGVQQCLLLCIQGSARGIVGHGGRHGNVE